jgi:hypothetical protein
MNSADRIDNHASDLLKAARAVHEAAAGPGSSKRASAALARLEEALQALSAGWYQVAADAVPGIAGRHRRLAGHPEPSLAAARSLSREQEVRLIGTLHDVAGAFARCARACRDAQPTVAPLIDGLAADTVCRAATCPSDRRLESRDPRACSTVADRPEGVEELSHRLSQGRWK